MPAMNNLLSRWIPVSERSRSLAFVYSGMYLGSVMGLAFSPSLIHTFNWPSVFFSFGSLGIVWFLMWQRFVSFSLLFKSTLLCTQLFFDRSKENFRLFYLGIKFPSWRSGYKRWRKDPTFIWCQYKQWTCYWHSMEALAIKATCLGANHKPLLSQLGHFYPPYMDAFILLPGNAYTRRFCSFLYLWRT